MENRFDSFMPLVVVLFFFCLSVFVLEGAVRCTSRQVEPDNSDWLGRVALRYLVAQCRHRRAHLFPTHETCALNDTTRIRWNGTGHVVAVMSLREFLFFSSRNNTCCDAFISFNSFCRIHIIDSIIDYSFSSPSSAGLIDIKNNSAGGLSSSSTTTSTGVDEREIETLCLLPRASSYQHRRA